MIDRLPVTQVPHDGEQLPLTVTEPAKDLAQIEEQGVVGALEIGHPEVQV
jgi:hypothetical protein